MKTTIVAMILTFSLGLIGCATPSGSGTAPVSSGAKAGKMLTDEDYKRIGVKEMGTR